MLRIALCAALIAAPGAVQAQARPSTTEMTCAGASALVASHGAVVLNTGPRTYDRFVSSHFFCQYDETLEPVWAPTADAAQCLVGYRCRPQPPLFDLFRR